MKIIEQYLTRNDCYTTNETIQPTGIMVHSTTVPGMTPEEWVKVWNKSYKAGEIELEVCVHAFVDDEKVIKCLPWNHRGWHAGGAANNTHISFEICEPRGYYYINGFTMVGYDPKEHADYFKKIWDNSVELCAMLCKEYNIKTDQIITHSEGHDMGLASDHKDVMHWFPKHGVDMDDFRKAVSDALKAE
ncbi:MAG: N-acetylmuramoyl-L-alanine amidase [Clostridiales bacterium]|jgi:N-acetylmuramoyl-L-alanine amidase|nr:N-acetylmuramoyl-L-alanine amidase [Clostridiales bacterium]